MTLGVVGSEAAKFTPETEAEARHVLRSLLTRYDVTRAVSGACHLGGIDIWAKEEAAALGLPFVEYPPATHAWTNGYRVRNIEIARASDWVVCVTVATLPSTYTGMTFDRCYHCDRDDHVKSGGCWTVKYARKLGKVGEVIVVGGAPR